MIRQDAVWTSPQREIGSIDDVEMHDRRVVVGSLDAFHLVPATGRNQWRRVLVAVLQPPEFEGRLDVLRGERDAIMPLDPVAKLPGDVHLVTARLDASVLEGWHFDGKLRHPVVRHLGVVRQRVLVGLYGEQTLHGRVDIGAGMGGRRRDIAGEQAILLLP